MRMVSEGALLPEACLTHRLAAGKRTLVAADDKTGFSSLRLLSA